MRLMEKMYIYLPKLVNLTKFGTSNFSFRTFKNETIEDSGSIGHILAYLRL